MTITNKHAYGWTPSLPDHRDFLYRVTEADVANLPAAVDNSKFLPPVLDQSQLGSCTAHGTTEAIRYNLIKSGKPDVELARLQLYYDSRALEGTVKQDAGAMIRDVMKTANKKGVAHESLWPYDISKFAKKPSSAVYKDALKEQVLMYSAVNVTANDVKAALAAGEVVVIGVTLYESFESDAVAKTGIVPMPQRTEQVLGGHCMLVWGYNQKQGYFSVRNSWGEGWGDKGNCYIPFEYIGSPDFGDDYWVIKTVE